MNKFFFLIPLFSSVSLFAQNNAPRKETNFIQPFILIIVAAVFFYFILWRPEKKRRKALENLRSSMKQGDKVTAMGIIGTVDKIQDTSVVLKMVDGSKIEVLKAAISELHATPVEEKKEAPQSK